MGQSPAKRMRQYRRMMRAVQAIGEDLTLIRYKRHKMPDGSTVKVIDWASTAQEVELAAQQERLKTDAA